MPRKVLRKSEPVVLLVGGHPYTRNYALVPGITEDEARAIMARIKAKG